MANTPPEAATKRCVTCATLLPLGAFNRRTKSPDGRASACRACANGRRRARDQPRESDELRAAIKQGDIKQVRKLYASARRDPSRLLAIAAQNYNTAPKHVGHLEIVDLLIAKGAIPDVEMVFEAARDGSQGIVDRLLAAGVDSDLFVAAANGDLPLAKQLLQRDRQLARSNAPGVARHYQGFTPLHACGMSSLGRNSPAKETSLLEVARLLIASGAEVNAVANFYGPLVVTPLDMAAHTGGNLGLCGLLIDHGARISSFAFLEALSHRGRRPADGFALAALFLERGFDVNALQGERTALHAAANSGGAATVEWLLAHGADVNARGRLDRTPLHLAAERNTSSKTVEVLVRGGADIHALDNQGLTALEVAQRHGKTAVRDFLRSLRQEPRA